MKTVITRVKKASVTVDQKLISQIDEGMLILVGFKDTDKVEEIEYMVNKILNLRIFDDDNGIMNKSILETKKEILTVSQFTLYANTKKGNRPSYKEALKSSEAKKLYDIFNNKLKEKAPVKTGIFQAEMQVESINNGPVTIIIEK